MKKLKFLYHLPHPSIYAGRSIHTGYMHAALSEGHEFKYLSADISDQSGFFSKYKPDIFITALNHYNIKFLDLSAMRTAKKHGMKVFVNTPFWKSPLAKYRFNETKSISEDTELRSLISNGFGDIYFNSCTQGDQRMDGFEKETGFHIYTVPLAADTYYMNVEKNSKFKSDIAYIGTNLPQKRNDFKERVYPLSKKYKLKIYGQDWSMKDQLLGWAQRFGQYFDIKVLKSFQKANLELSDEASIYKSTMICINIHEDYQRKFGGDCNERTFKIPLFGGFQICDDVSCIKEYFDVDKEIIIAETTNDWFEKIDYYFKNPDKRATIIEAGKQRVLNNHTYVHRLNELIAMYQAL